MKEQNTGEVDAMADVLDGWNHNDAKQVLQAVHQASQGNITKGHLLEQIAAVIPTGDFRDNIDEQGKIIKNGKRFVTFYVAIDEDYEFEAASDAHVATENLSGMHRIVKFSGWMARPKAAEPKPTVVTIPDEEDDDEITHHPV